MTTQDSAGHNRANDTSRNGHTRTPDVTHLQALADWALPVSRSRTYQFMFTNSRVLTINSCTFHGSYTHEIDRRLAVTLDRSTHGSLDRAQVACQVHEPRCSAHAAAVVAQHQGRFNVVGKWRTRPKLRVMSATSAASSGDFQGHVLRELCNWGRTSAIHS